MTYHQQQILLLHIDSNFPPHRLTAETHIGQQELWHT